MTERTLTGGCLCGGVAYKITIPAEPLVIPGIPYHPPITAFDHCGDCRKSAGTLFQSWIIVPQTWITVTTNNKHDSVPSDGNESEQPTTTLVDYTSSPHVSRSFCGRCGTHLFFSNENRRQRLEKAGFKFNIVDVTLGSLDADSLAQAEIVKPQMHLWWDYGVEWLKDMIETGEMKNLRKYPNGNISTKRDDNVVVPVVAPAEANNA